LEEEVEEQEQEHEQEQEQEQEQERGGRGRAAGMMRRRGKTTSLHPCKAARPKSYRMR
jgi:hypothetical protein